MNNKTKQDKAKPDPQTNRADWWLPAKGQWGGGGKQVKGSLVNNGVVTLPGDRRPLDLWGDRVMRYVNVKSLCCTHTANRTSYANYTLMKKNN